MSGCGCEVEIKDASQRRVLYWLLSINALMFFVEFALGWIAQSTALIADSLDMLADAVVYGIGLYAVGKTLTHKANAALASGYLQLMLAVLILMDITRRLMFGNEPDSMLMVLVGCIALVANVICLVLIQRHKSDEVHMRASWIFSANDVIANVGVIFGGALVFWSGQRWPDMVIGLIISIIVFKGALRILKDARHELDTIASAGISENAYIDSNGDIK
ncbi:cation diffusion facilitator family transporter [Paraglaciecola arctica]|uniref:Cation efflux protein n=1 Tax=Paraglaciecola arctica BSs20135 TaxID=493475 RepID=K6YMT9_9ALTE|nr:cation diffusion facilitator family transporter [Paraglaciecola arctica]GAC19497.1 cation efflux protein [Paraglaciecola arctica BSs20135]